MDFCTRELDLTIFFKMSAKKPQFVTLKPLAIETSENTKMNGSAVKEK